MGILTDFKEYTDPHGLISNEKNPKQSSGNCILFTGESALCLRVTREWTANMAAGIRESMMILEIIPGFFLRTPYGTQFHADQESGDDYVGLGFLSALVVGPSLAQRILAYGRAHYFQWGPFRFRYAFDTAQVLEAVRGKVDPPTVTRNASAWLGRFVALIAHLRWAADERPNLFERLGWFYAVAIGPKKGDLDSWILSAILVETSGHEGWIETFASWIRFRRVRWYYKFGLRDVLEAYFGKDHPITQHWPVYAW